MKKRFYIDFSTREMPGRILATCVMLGQEVVRDQNKVMSIDLCSHPLYERLERYVLANPSVKRLKEGGK
jgi:hypothetical protein